MEIRVLFHASRGVDSSIGSIRIGKYRMEPLPQDTIPDPDYPAKYLLRFDDEIRADEGRSLPGEEARLFLALSSVAFCTRIRRAGMMVDFVSTSSITVPEVYRSPESPIADVTELQEALERLSQKDVDVARQFLRAAEVFRLAQSVMGENNTLSFFLLSIAVECLANKLVSGGGNCDRFIAFILKYLPDRSAFASEDEWREVLKEIYYNHRSGFTHGGKDIPDAVLLADRLGRAYVKNTIDGKEIKTPGLKWFAGVVRACLLSFLKSADGLGTQPKDHLKDLSLERGVVMLTAKRALSRGQPITAEDVDID